MVSSKWKIWQIVLPHACDLRNCWNSDGKMWYVVHYTQTLFIFIHLLLSLSRRHIDSKAAASNCQKKIIAVSWLIESNIHSRHIRFCFSFYELGDSWRKWTISPRSNHFHVFSPQLHRFWALTLNHVVVYGVRFWYRLRRHHRVHVSILLLPILGPNRTMCSNLLSLFYCTASSPLSRSHSPFLIFSPIFFFCVCAVQIFQHSLRSRFQYFWRDSVY